MMMVSMQMNFQFGANFLSLILELIYNQMILNLNKKHFFA